MRYAELRPIGGVNGKDGVTLNIVEASIAEAAKSILGDVLGVPYTVSDRVKGTITIQMTKAFPKTRCFRSSKMSCAVRVRPSSCRREPTAPSGQRSGRVRSAQDGWRQKSPCAGRDHPRGGIGVRSCREMGRILKEIAPNANILRTDTARNLLWFRARAPISTQS